jgi:5'-3' exonuclease
LPAPLPPPLLAVDAPSMLFRAFYGAANLIVREVELYRPRAVVLCFGPDAASYRTELFPAYHADRDEVPDELAPQWADCRDFFEAFGWTVATSGSLEADDLLGTFARREAEAGGRALLLTGDRDMYQCAGEGVTILYVSTGGKAGAEEVTAAGVRERYGVDPAQVPDFIALRGDPSDGIPGAKGVGPKTAAELLRRHGSLEALLDSAIREPRPKLRGTLIEGREELLAFKDIATLRDAGVDRPPDRPTDWMGAAAAARERGMNRLAERFEQNVE